MVEMKTEITEPDSSAISLPDDETINTEKSAADTVIPKEAHTAGAPTIEEVTKVIQAVEKQEAPNGSSDDTAVKTGGHQVTASEGGTDAEKKDSNGGAEQTESRSHREDNHRNSHNTNKKYNNSQKPYKDFRNNVKSDLTAQEESSDPVEIRKQVQGLLGFLWQAQLTVASRSNSTSPTLISLWTISSSAKSRATRTCPCRLASSTPSSVCATFNPSRLWSLL